jgi:methyltransferase (TIGR00027 family)
VRGGEVSMTARRVAAQRIRFPRVEVGWGDPEADQRLHADVSAGLVVGTTGMTRFLAARTRWVDQVVVDAIADGIEQFVAVGAGYDGRGLRYGRDRLRWFELDHPDTQADKRERLRRLDISATDITFVSADFERDDPGSALVAAGLDATRTCLMWCEGVAAYLTRAALTALLTSLAGCASQDSRLAITVAVEAGSIPERLRRAALQAAVSAMGEPLQSALPRDQFNAFFDAAGWTVERAVDAAGVPVVESPRTSAFVLATPR